MGFGGIGLLKPGRGVAWHPAQDVTVQASPHEARREVGHRHVLVPI